MIRPLPTLYREPMIERAFRIFLAAVLLLCLSAIVARADEPGSLPQFAAAVKSAWHVPHSLSDVLLDLGLATIALALLSTMCSALANKFPDTPGLGHAIHVVALNISKTASTVKAIDAFALDIAKGNIAVPTDTSSTPVPLSGSTTITPPPA